MIENYWKFNYDRLPSKCRLFDKKKTIQFSLTVLRISKLYNNNLFTHSFS